MESTVFFFVNATKKYQLKAKDSEKKDYELCLCNVSKDFKINNMKKKTRLKLVGKFLSVDFNPIETNNIIGMHK